MLFTQYVYRLSHQWVPAQCPIPLKWKPNKVRINWISIYMYIHMCVCVSYWIYAGARKHKQPNHIQPIWMTITKWMILFHIRMFSKRNRNIYKTQCHHSMINTQNSLTILLFRPMHGTYDKIEFSLLYTKQWSTSTT